MRVVQSGIWPIGSKALVKRIAHSFRERIELYMKLKANSLEDQFRPNDSEPEFQNHYKQFRSRVQQFRNTSFESSIQSVSGNEVRNIIKHLKIIKASGHNAVNNSILKQLPYHCVTHFNSIPKLQYFPDT